MRYGGEKLDSGTRAANEESVTGRTVADAPVELRLFGPMVVRVNGLPMPRLRSRKGIWLLAILALRPNRDVERSWLAGTLWPECADGDALRSLRQSLYDLRLALGH